LVAAHLIGSVAIGIPFPGLMAWAWGSGVDPVLVGLLGAGRLAPYVALGWLAGAVAGRASRTVVYGAASLLRVLALGLLVIGAAAGSLPLACGAAIAAVALGTPTFPTAAAALPALSRWERPTTLLVTAEVLAFPAGAALGGLAATVPLAGALGAVLAAGLGCTLLWAIDLGRGAPADVSYGSQLRSVLANPQARGAIIAVAALNASIGALGVALLPLAHDSWAAGDGEYGFLTAALGVGAVAAPLLARLLRAPAGIATWLVAASVPLVFIAVAPGWRWAVPLVAAFGALATQAECAVTMVLQRSVADAERVCALGLADTALYASAAVGAASAPLLLAFISPSGLVVVQLVLTVGAALVCRAQRELKPEHINLLADVGEVPVWPR